MGANFIIIVAQNARKGIGMPCTRVSVVISEYWRNAIDPLRENFQNDIINGIDAENIPELQELRSRLGQSRPQTTI